MTQKKEGADSIEIIDVDEDEEDRLQDWKLKKQRGEDQNKKPAGSKFNEEERRALSKMVHFFNRSRILVTTTALMWLIFIILYD